MTPVGPLRAAWKWRPDLPPDRLTVAGHRTGAALRRATFGQGLRVHAEALSSCRHPIQILGGHISTESRGGPISTEPRINDRIRVSEVRLVGPNGEQVGIVRIEDAIRLAQEADLDLVEVAPGNRP
ncbi:MAG: translation initiation factor IF-3, partial [Propionibacteriaceae bacterium]